MKTSNKLNLAVQAPVSHESLPKDGYTIHYFASGSKDKELLLFLHPAFADHRCFNKQIDFFSEKYRVVTIDLLGHGLSQVEKSADKIDASVVHIEEIIKKEGSTKAHIAGVSMGSLLAQYFALQHPEKVSSLTVLGGYTINEENKAIIRAQRNEGLKWLVKVFFSMNSFRRYAATASVNKPEEQARFFEMAGLYKRKSFLLMSGLQHLIKNRPNSPRNYPLLILYGDKDLQLVQDMAERWHKTDASSQRQVIPNAGHCANMDNAPAFNRILLNFLQGSVENKTTGGKNEE